jgi:hypothetical protein
MRITRTATTTTAIAGLALVTLLPSASPAASSTPAGTPPAASGLLASSSPKTVVLNPATGAVVSVTPGKPARVTSRGR